MDKSSTSIFSCVFIDINKRLNRLNPEFVVRGEKLASSMADDLLIARKVKPA